MTNVHHSLFIVPCSSAFWSAQTVSAFGTYLGALGLLAILFYGASPAEMGVLGAVQAAPALGLGLFAGVWVDRVPRRPLLVAADVGRGLLLLGAALGAGTGRLPFAALYLIAFLVGALSVLHQLAQEAFLPALVPPEQLVAANGRLAASDAVAESVSPGVGGLLVQALGAPLALLLDGVSYLLSAALLATVRVPEIRVLAEPGPALRRLRIELGSGLAALGSEARLRALAGAGGMRSFFGAFFGALYGIFLLRTLALSPAAYGIIVGTGGIGAFLGALLAGRLAARWGTGRLLRRGLVGASLLSLLVPWAGGPRWAVVSLLVAAQVLGDTALTLFFIGSRSVRQANTPAPLLGRVGAAFQLLDQGGGTLGLLLGGVLGEWLGIRATLFLGAVGSLAAVLWLIPGRKE